MLNLDFKLFLQLDGLFAPLEAVDRVNFALVVSFHKRIQLEFQSYFEALLRASEQTLELFIELNRHTLQIVQRHRQHGRVLNGLDAELAL